MAKGGKNNSTKPRSQSQRKDDAERKRDERTRRNALKKERQSKQYYPFEDDENFVSFRNQLESLAFKIKDIPGDGNCLFRALADQLEGDHKIHSKYRTDTVHYMRTNIADFAPFHDNTDMSFEKYLDNLAKDGTYAGNDAIVAFARNSGVNVVIHQFNNPRFVIEGYQQTTQIIELHIAYHNGEHYSSLRKTNDPGTGPAYTYHSNAVMNKVEPIGKIQETRRSPPKTKLSSKCDTDSDDIDNFTEEEMKIMETSGCKNRDLIREAFHDHEYDVDGTLGYIMQVMCLNDDEAVTEGESTPHQDQPAKINKEDAQDVCPCDCNCSGECNQVNRQTNVESPEKSTKLGGATRKKTSHLTNRQRKELAKKEKKERRTETQRNTTKEESASPTGQEESARPLVPDLGAVRI